MPHPVRDPHGRQERKHQTVETPDLSVAPQIDGALTTPATDPAIAPTDAAQATPEAMQDPSAPENQPQAEPEPKWFEIPDEEGRPYTRINERELPNVIREKDRYNAELRRQNEALMQMLQSGRSPEPQQPAKDPAKQRADFYVERMKARGYEPDPNFAELLAEVEQNVAREFQQKQAVEQGYRHAAEYNEVASEKSWFQIRRNPSTGVIEGHPLVVAAYVQHPGLSPKQHAAIAEREAQRLGIQLTSGIPNSQQAQQTAQSQAQARAATVDKFRFAGNGATVSQQQRSDPAELNESIQRVIGHFGRRITEQDKVRIANDMRAEYWANQQKAR